MVELCSLEQLYLSGNSLKDLFYPSLSSHSIDPHNENDRLPFASLRCLLLGNPHKIFLPSISASIPLCLACSFWSSEYRARFMWLDVHVYGSELIIVHGIMSAGRNQISDWPAVDALDQFPALQVRLHLWTFPSLCFWVIECRALFLVYLSASIAGCFFRPTIWVPLLFLQWADT